MHVSIEFIFGMHIKCYDIILFLIAANEEHNGQVILVSNPEILNCLKAML